MTYGLLEITMVLALFAGLISLAIGLVQFWRGKTTTEGLSAEENQMALLIRQGEERLASMVTMLESNQQTRFDNLRSEISAVRAEIDWLTGEQMIEQAISMAREGVSAEEISAELGMSYDAAEALKAVHVH